MAGPRSRGCVDYPCPPVRGNHNHPVVGGAAVENHGLPPAGGCPGPGPLSSPARVHLRSSSEGGSGRPLAGNEVPRAPAAFGCILGIPRLPGPPLEAVTCGTRVGHRGRFNAMRAPLTALAIVGVRTFGPLADVAPALFLAVDAVTGVLTGDRRFVSRSGWWLIGSTGCPRSTAAHLFPPLFPNPCQSVRPAGGAHQRKTPP